MLIFFVIVWENYILSTFTVTDYELRYNWIVGEDMNKKLIHSSVQILKKSGKYSDEQIEIIIYGLEGLYLTFFPFSKNSILPPTCIYKN